MKVHILTTGGTIEKVYSEQYGTVVNVLARINQYVERLRLPDTQIDVTPLMNKDSLEMTGEDREQILEAVRARIVDSPVVLTHGTDTMVETGRMLKARLGGLAFPVILTGAMTPLGFERSDGLQNLTESLFEAKLGVRPVYFRPPYSIDQEPDTNDQAEPIAHIQGLGYVIVGDKIVASGEVVLVNGNFGLRVTQVAEPQKRLESIRCLF